MRWLKRVKYAKIVNDRVIPVQSDARFSGLIFYWSAPKLKTRTTYPRYMWKVKWVEKFFEWNLHETIKSAPCSSFVVFFFIRVKTQLQTTPDADDDNASSVSRLIHYQLAWCDCIFTRSVVFLSQIQTKWNKKSIEIKFQVFLMLENFDLLLKNWERDDERVEKFREDVNEEGKKEYIFFEGVNIAHKPSN